MSAGKFWLASFLVAAALLLLTRWQIAERVFLFRRLCGAAIRRAGDRVEHPRRLYRLHQFRHRRVFRLRRLQLGRAPQADLGPDPGDDPGRRTGLGTPRLWHGLSDPAAEGGVFCHRDPGPGDRGADPDRQLGLRRRLARHLHHPAAAVADPWRLYPIPLFLDAVAELGVAGDRPHDRALAARARARRNPRRRAGGRGERRADPAAQADRHHA